MRYILHVLLVFSFVQSRNLPEPPWDEISMGIMGGSGNSVTFLNNNKLYGLDILTFGFDLKEENTSISAYILMPRIGKRFNLRSVNRLNSYYKGEINLIIPFVSIDIDGESTTELENDIKDIVDMLGFKLAYGIEYKFNEQLSFWRANIGEVSVIW